LKRFRPIWEKVPAKSSRNILKYKVDHQVIKKMGKNISDAIYYQKEPGNNKEMP